MKIELKNKSKDENSAITMFKKLASRKNSKKQFFESIYSKKELEKELREKYICYKSVTTEYEAKSSLYERLLHEFIASGARKEEEDNVISSAVEVISLKAATIDKEHQLEMTIKEYEGNIKKMYDLNCEKRRYYNFSKGLEYLAYEKRVVSSNVLNILREFHGEAKVTDVNKESAEKSTDSNKRIIKSNRPTKKAS